MKKNYNINKVKGIGYTFIIGMLVSGLFFEEVEAASSRRRAAKRAKPVVSAPVITKAPVIDVPKIEPHVLSSEAPQPIASEDILISEPVIIGENIQSLSTADRLIEAYAPLWFKSAWRGASNTKKAALVTSGVVATVLAAVALGYGAREGISYVRPPAKVGQEGGSEISFVDLGIKEDLDEKKKEDSGSVLDALVEGAQEKATGFVGAISSTFGLGSDKGDPVVGSGDSKPEDDADSGGKKLEVVVSEEKGESSSEENDDSKPVQGQTKDFADQLSEAIESGRKEAEELAAKVKKNLPSVPSFSSFFKSK